MALAAALPRACSSNVDCRAGENLSDKENIASKPSATKDSDSDDELDAYLARRAGSGSQPSQLFKQPLAGSKPAAPDAAPSRTAAYTSAAPATAAGRTSAATGSALQQQASAGQAAKPPARASNSSRKRSNDSDEDSDEELEVGSAAHGQPPAAHALNPAPPALLPRPARAP